MDFRFSLCNRAALVVIATALVPHFARADRHTADFVLPQIGQRGTDVEVWIRGTHLETAEEVLFYRPGIECIRIRQLSEIENETGNREPKPVEPGTAIGLTFRIAPDAELGEYYLRVRTRKKLSELLSFWVTPFPVIPENHPYYDTPEAGNDNAERAQVIPLGFTVVGYHGSADINDRDVYRVTLEKGQRCTAQILNSRLGTHHYAGLTDMQIEVRSPSDQRVARANYSPLFGQDPLVSFFAPEAGYYHITVSQQMDSEELLRHYALHVGDFPRPAVTYPLGGQAGSPLDLEVFSADGSRSRLLALLPEEVGEFEAALVSLTEVADFPSIPSPNLLKVADFPNVFETGKSKQPEKAQKIGQALPVALNGIIATEGEKDWFRFTAKKGERYRVRTYARTLGSKLDPFVWIQPADGNPSRINIAEDDSVWDGHDWEGHHYRHQVQDRLDPIFMFEPDEDGDYLIGIGDTRRESGDDYVYRVEFQPHRDSLFTYYADYPSQASIVRDVITIHRGTNSVRPIAIQNGFGSQYNGPIRLEAIGLPPSITFECPVFTKDDPIILASFTSQPGAELSSGLFELVPRALEEGVDLRGAFAQTSASTDRRGGYAMVFNRTRKLAYAVLEEAPFAVTIDQPSIALARNAELRLNVNVQRKGDFTGAIYLEMDWLPKGVIKQPPLIIPEGETVGHYVLSASAQAPAGDYRVSITAREYEGGNPSSGVGYHYIASPLITIQISDPYLKIDLARAAIEQGKPGKITGTVEHLRPFSGTATARLLRLPAGVSLVREPTIRPGDQTVTFAVEVAQDALTGQYQEIGCDITIQDSGQAIHQQTGSGTLRIDAKRN